MRFFVFCTGTKSLKKYLLLGLYLGLETLLLDLKIFKILEFHFVLFGPLKIGFLDQDKDPQKNNFFINFVFLYFLGI
jgi:hypothetical protein